MERNFRMKIDVIGDIHGCYQEFQVLTKSLGYSWEEGFPLHTEGRQLGFVGDLTDRGPQSLAVIDVVWELVINQQAGYYVPGNHCNKLFRFFSGNKVQITHGLETTVSEYEAFKKPKQRKIRERFIELYESSTIYQVLDNGRVVIAHAGILQEDIGKINSKVKTFVLYGDITGEKHPDGSPVRRDWAKQYRGDAIIIYGHTPVSEVRIVHNTYNIDTGAVFGGKLSALRYPELEIVSVPSTMPKVAEKFRNFD